MPMYDLRCETSGKRFERMIPLRDFEAPVFCACKSLAKRLISKPMFVVEDVGYSCPVTAKWIGSKREHERNLSENNCRVLEPGEDTALSKKKQLSEDQFDKALEDTVEKEFESMPSDKKEKLSNEMLNGIDVSYERTAP